ncbi:uncharacterized protein EI90DRAFT_1489661 [Cantharellus anzutake]|uniref:uncharacterized protein n=1 Tax=Cantharellus anzutake TaxID=1750568 RepID=UPI0019057481|nr:uncharacterized protein EI90DRAFT_1489661 [Cantharellus anzutake]KAF8328908.1 hypothetical protein EI90DRAFT_1489661 [Cantharellus anzutake]
MSILDLTWGVALAFAVFSTVLSGILTVQVCVYSAKFPHDSLFVKCTVWTVFILEILHNSFTWRLLHHYLIASYSNFSKLALVEWGITPAVIFQATVTCVVQLFYVRRCWLVNRKHWVIPMITAFLSFGSFSAGCYAAVAAIRTKKSGRYPDFLLHYFLDSRITNGIQTY